MNRLEKTLEIYRILGVKVSLHMTEFFRPIYEMFEQYNKEELGMIGSVGAFATYALTNHHELSEKTEWVIDYLEGNLLSLKIQRVTTEEVEIYFVYFYKDGRIKEWYKI